MEKTMSLLARLASWCYLAIAFVPRRWPGYHAAPCTSVVPFTQMRSRLCARAVGKIDPRGESMEPPSKRASRYTTASHVLNHGRAKSQALTRDHSRRILKRPPYSAERLDWTVPPLHPDNVIARALDRAQFSESQSLNGSSLGMGYQLRSSTKY